MNEEERMCYVSRLADGVTKDFIEELFTQVGPVEKVVFRDTPVKFALVVFEDEESVLFAVETLDETRLFGQNISVRPKNGSEQLRKYEALKRSRPVVHNSQAAPEVRYKRGEVRESTHGVRNVREGNWRQSWNDVSVHHPQQQQHQQASYHRSHSFDAHASGSFVRPDGFSEPRHPAKRGRYEGGDQFGSRERIAPHDERSSYSSSRRDDSWSGTPTQQRKRGGGSYHSGARPPTNYARF